MIKLHGGGGSYNLATVVNRVQIPSDGRFAFEQY